VDSLAVSLASDVNPLRTALTLAYVIGFAFPANYINHAPLVGAPLREFDFNRTLAGLLTTGIFTSHAMRKFLGGFSWIRSVGRPQAGVVGSLVLPEA
jgi:hypothetical protein